MSQQVEADKIVSVAYTIRDGSGKIVEHTGLPVSYLHGGDDPPLFPQVTAALEGLSAGDTTEVLLRAQEAFGRLLASPSASGKFQLEHEASNQLEVARSLPTRITIS